MPKKGKHETKSDIKFYLALIAVLLVIIVVLGIYQAILIPAGQFTAPVKQGVTAPELPTEQCLRLTSYLPENDIPDLPQSYMLSNLPSFRLAENKYQTAVAALKMLADTFRPNNGITENMIAESIGASQLYDLNRKTSRENVVEFVHNQLGISVSVYYPVSYIYGSGTFGTIEEASATTRMCSKIIAEYDIPFYKNLLVKTQYPVYIRLRNEGLGERGTYARFPMDERYLEYTDIVGISALLVGYDETGFIFYIPWDKEQWGGDYGGTNVKIAYEMFWGDPRPFPSVDASLDWIMAFNGPKVIAETNPVSSGKTFILPITIDYPRPLPLSEQFPVKDAKITIKSSFGTLINDIGNIAMGETKTTNVRINAPNIKGVYNLEIVLTGKISSSDAPDVDLKLPSYEAEISSVTNLPLTVI